MSAKHKLVFAFIDTNIFIEFKPINNLNWNELLEAEEVVLLVARSVIDELENQKIHARGRVQKRAKAALTFMPEDYEAHKLKKGLSLQCLYPRHTDYEKYLLDQTKLDDQLVLAAIHFCQENPNVEVKVIADDSGVRRTANHNKVSGLRPPEEWRLDPEIDATEKENERLKQQIAAAIPKLSVTFNDCMTHHSFTLAEPPNGDPITVYQIMEKAKAKHKFLDVNTMPMVLIQVPGLSPSASAIAQYNDELRSYFAELERQLPAWLQYKQVEARMIPIKLTAHNTGRRPANDIVVKLEFPKMVTVSFEPPTEIHLPKPPQLELVQLKAVQQLSQYSQLNHLPNAMSIPQHGQKAPVLTKKISGNKAEFEIVRLQHQQEHSLPTVYANFDDWSAATGFEIACFYLCDELPEQETNPLHIKIQHGGTGTSAVWNVPFIND